VKRVWAIVLMYGGEHVTAACIESLLSQDYPELSILLVDNQSQSGGGGRLHQRFPTIEYLDTGGNLGYAGGNNRGITYALDHGAAYLLILNNDTTLDPACVSRLVETAEAKERVGVVAPKILYFDEPELIWYGGGHLSTLRAVGEHRHRHQRDDRSEAGVAEPVTFASGCAFLMPAAVARATQGFAEDFFMYCEDVDLSIRLEKAGYGLYYQPAARVYHRENLLDNPTPFQIRLRDRNRRRVVRRHYRPFDKLRFALWFYPTRVLRVTQYLARADLARAGAIIAGAIER
jgi:GT2 family glycosyltransferase